MELKELYQVFAKHPEQQWIMQAENVQQLYNFTKKHPIKRVLDLGTGIGTSVSIVALALKNKGEIDFHIDTIEQSDKCIAVAKELVPKELQEHITFHKSEAVTWESTLMPHQTFSTYENIPEGDYDLIINDGPSPWLDKDGHYIDLPNATVTELLLKDKIKPGAFVAWDGRQHMVSILERYFSDNFYLARPANLQRDDLNILKRKDNPVNFRDERLEAMKNSTYFK